MTIQIWAIFQDKCRLSIFSQCRLDFIFSVLTVVLGQFYTTRTILTFHILNIHKSWYFWRSNVSSHLMNPGVFFFLGRWNFVLFSLTDSLNLWMWKLNFQKRLSHPWPLSWSTTSRMFLSLISSTIFVSLLSLFLFVFYYLPQFYFILSLILFSHRCADFFLYFFSLFSKQLLVFPRMFAGLLRVKNQNCFHR